MMLNKGFVYVLPECKKLEFARPRGPSQEEKGKERVLLKFARLPDVWKSLQDSQVINILGG